MEQIIKYLENTFKNTSRLYANNNLERNKGDSRINCGLMKLKDIQLANQLLDLVPGCTSSGF